MKIMITGANGHLGRRLTSRLSETREVVAAVRSERARGNLLAFLGDKGVAVPIVDYADPDSLAEAGQGSDVIVHLVGIIKETADNSYEQAHEAASRALVEAGRRIGAGKIIHVSILGCDTDADNACLASKARAERILLDSPVETLVLRVPMVLGEGDYASMALQHKAARGTNLELRAESLEQPIYAGDLIEALVRGIEGRASGVVELAGPESIPRRELIERAARVRGRSTRVISIPLRVGMIAGCFLEKLPNPPVTRAMLGVLDHDDRIDPQPACALLDIELTQLDETLERVLSG